MNTVKDLIHELSAEWVDVNKPVHVSFYDSEGRLRIFQITGVNCRAQGQSLQLLEVE